MHRVIIIVFLLWAQTTWTQQAVPFYKKLTYSAQLDLQGFSLPFTPLKIYKQNTGAAVGVFMNWNRKGSLQQVIKMGTIYNQQHGSFSYLSTSLCFNPLHAQKISAGVSLGAGYMLTRSRSIKWSQDKNAEWASGKNQKCVGFIPASVQVTVKVFEDKNMVLWPFLAYQVNALLAYTPKSFVLPQNIISIGTQLKIK